VSAVLTSIQLELLSKFEDDYAHISSEDELWDLLRRVDSPLQLHYLPEILNWDSGWTYDIVGWILEHPLCDAGTILLIYWMNDPRFYKKHERAGTIPKWAERGYELHKKCEALYLGGRISSGTIRYNPRDGRDLPVRPERDSADDLLIPPELKTASTGEEVVDYSTAKESYAQAG
jgi:hypothetical protein